MKKKTNTENFRSPLNSYPSPASPISPIGLTQDELPEYERRVKQFQVASEGPTEGIDYRRPSHSPEAYFLALESKNSPTLIFEDPKSDDQELRVPGFVEENSSIIPKKLDSEEKPIELSAQSDWESLLQTSVESTAQSSQDDNLKPLDSSVFDAKFPNPFPFSELGAGVRLSFDEYAGTGLSGQKDQTNCENRKDDRLSIESSSQDEFTSESKTPYSGDIQRDKKPDTLVSKPRVSFIGFVKSGIRKIIQRICGNSDKVEMER